MISRPDYKNKVRKVHAEKNGRPLCGGGYLARLVSGWQTEIAEVNCKRCRKILKLTQT